MTSAELKNRKCTNWPHDDFETLIGQKYPAYTKYPPPLEAHISVHFNIRRAVFKVLKCTQWPQMILNSNDKPLCTLSTYLLGANFGPFRSTNSRFWDIRLLKIGKLGNAPNALRLASKVPCISSTYRRGPHFCSDNGKKGQNFKISISQLFWQLW